MVARPLFFVVLYTLALIASAQLAQAQVSVQVTPDNGPHPDPAIRFSNTTGNQITFTVTNTGTMDTYYSGTCTRTGNVVSVTCTNVGLIADGGSKIVTATFSTGAASTGTVQLAVTATNPTGASATGKWDETIVNPGARVTPDAAPATVPPIPSWAADFTVTNTSVAQTTYTLVAVCTGTGVSGCSLSPTSLVLAGSATGTARITFTPGASGTTAVVELQARLGATSLDVGTVSVTVAPVLDVSSVNPGAVLARAQCLTIALASAAASECGDLRIVQPLPSVRTMNAWRTPTLAYTSAQAIGWASVGANVTLPTGSQVPTTVSALLKIFEATRASGSWAGSQWAPGTVRRIALGFSGPAVGLTTGVYDYRLEVTKAYPGSSQTDTAYGKLVIVDRSASYFGAGWWLAGLEQWDQVTGVWIGGDGSARQYALLPGTITPNRVWGAPSVAYPDTIRESGTEFVRQLPDSVWVFFNAQGRHVRTRNRQGHVTTFTYDGSGTKLATITLPPPGASPLSYSVNYVNGRVSTIVAPGVPLSRTTTLTINATTGRLTNILEPDGRSVGFGYVSDHKIMSRTDRRSTVTNLQYDAGGRVSQATINLAPGTITRTLQQASSQGFGGSSVPLSQAFTRLDGPRAVNTTSFYLNRFAAPDSIIDALVQRTRLFRGDARFLGIVNQLTTGTGHIITATYDARGRVLTSIEQSTSAALATTTYQWDGKWDQVTRITNPEGDLVDYGVDPPTGNRVWQQDGRGSSTRTQFQYYPDNQVSNIIPPNSDLHSYAYDAKGNLQTYFSALDRGFTWTNNNIGLTTQIQTPTGMCCQPGWPPYQTETINYSIRNEDTLRVTSLSGQSTTVRRTYDAEGNLDTLTRTFAPNPPPGISSLTTSWQYDRANRPTRQTEPDGSFEQRWFDASANMDSAATRRGLKIRMTYDPLNRLSTRAVPAVRFSLPASQITPATQVNALPYSYAWTVDDQTFQYSTNGQVSRATNKDATVARSFHPNGRLLAETLYIKSTPRTTNHVYTTTYAYDRNGRRNSMTAPALFTGGAIGYGYSSQWGALTSVTNLAGNTFSFTYNNRSELTGISYGGGMSETLGYDGDGRLSSDVITDGPNQAFPFYPGTQLRNFAVSMRNARDQILSSSDAVQSDQVNATYSGLGYLKTSNLHQSLVSGVTGAASYASGDTTTYDGLGNILTTVSRDSVGNGSGWIVTVKTGSNTYVTVGRLNTRGLGGANTAYSYDASGNAFFEATTLSPNVTSERAAYHGADEKLLATDTRASGQRTFEEYRYDALGRRVWVKSVKTCEPSSQGVDCNTPYVRRTIWDGVQELAEIQVPVNLGNAAIEEMDTGYPIVSWNFSPADPNPFYGRVVYGPGLAVDQPLTVTRYDYRDQPSSGSGTLTWPRFTWQVYWNYQGLPAYGTLTTGAWAYPYQLGQGQTSCPAVGNQTTQRCVIVQWPLMHSAYDRNRGNVQYRSWHGSLFEGKRDRSGLEYRRNRLYDPQTGRFTQEDPIGLASGVNLYGFAGGDPVSFADPYGLDRIYQDEYGKVVERVVQAGPDEYYLRHGGQEYRLDYRLKPSRRPYIIYSEAATRGKALQIVNRAPRGYDTDLELAAHSWRNGLELDFKQYLQDRSLYFLGDGRAAHKHAPANMAWGFYVAREGVPLDRALRGAGLQGNFVAGSEDALDQEMIARGYSWWRP